MSEPEKKVVNGRTNPGRAMFAALCDERGMANARALGMASANDWQLRRKYR